VLAESYHIISTENLRYLESIKVEREVNQVVAKLIEFDDWLVGRKAKHMAKDNAQYHFEL